VSPVLTLDRATFLELQALEDVQLRPDYSGRAMYGDTCLALVVDDVSELVRFLLGLAELVNDTADELSERVGALVDELRTCRTRADQLGRSYVYYWPTVTVEP
jgi:hypothetical protein